MPGDSACSADDERGDPRDPTYWALLGALVAVLATCGAETWLRPPAGVTLSMWAGRAAVVLGAALTVWARVVMGKSYAPTARNLDPAQALVTTGPYRWLRHPQYLGNVLSLAGLVLALGLTWSWLALLPFGAALAWRIRLEQAFLAEKFPA